MLFNTFSSDNMTMKNSLYLFGLRKFVSVVSIYCYVGVDICNFQYLLSEFFLINKKKYSCLWLKCFAFQCNENYIITILGFRTARLALSNPCLKWNDANYCKFWHLKYNIHYWWYLMHLLYINIYSNLGMYSISKLVEIYVHV